MSGKVQHQHDEWQIEENADGTWCRACGEQVSYRWPEHEKLRKVSDKSQTIGEFIEWLAGEKEIFLAQWQADHVRAVSAGMTSPVQTLLAEFFGIDEDRLEQEKRAMLEQMRAQ